MAFKVLITDPISDTGIKILEERGLEVVYKPNYPEVDLNNNVLETIDGWIIRSGTQIDNSHFEIAKKLKVVGRAGVGIDNIDIKNATRTGCLVMNVPDGNSISAAEHTVAMMSALSRNIHKGHMTLINGAWERSNLIGNELQNKTLGVIGLGRIGREVIKRAQSYDMKILGFDPYVNESLFEGSEVELSTLEKIYTKSDYITLHVPLVDSTKHMISMKTLKKMKRTARIINVARGGIINENDLAEALNSNIIAGAAIDVFESEPLSKDSVLLSSKNILLTPHLGASTYEAKEGVSLKICQQVSDYLLDGKLLNPINLPFSSFEDIKTLTPFLNLAEVMGTIQSQIIKEPIKSISIQCFGEVEEGKILSIGVLKGLLGSITDNRINYINAHSVANERGIAISYSHSSESIAYTNSIKSIVQLQNKEITIEGSVFSDNIFRITNILGFDIDFIPSGHILCIYNKDVPGVVGSVGGVLGKNKINIAEFILSRSSSNNTACSIVKIDDFVDKEVIGHIESIPEVTKVFLLKV
jgi:D-3-phosphoglycerate dehydrogenase